MSRQGLYPQTTHRRILLQLLITAYNYWSVHYFLSSFWAVVTSPKLAFPFFEAVVLTAPSLGTASNRALVRDFNILALHLDGNNIISIITGEQLQEERKILNNYFAPLNLNNDMYIYYHRYKQYLNIKHMSTSLLSSFLFRETTTFGADRAVIITRAMLLQLELRWSEFRRFWSAFRYSYLHLEPKRLRYSFILYI